MQGSVKDEPWKSIFDPSWRWPGISPAKPAGRKEEGVEERRRMDLGLLRDVIALLDGYRINRYRDPKPFSDAIREGHLGEKLREEWPRVEHILLEMAGTPGELPPVLRLFKLRSVLNYMGYLFATVILLLVLARLILSYNPGGYWGYMVVASIILIPGSWLAAQYMNYRIALEVERYYRDNPHLHRREKLYLKEMNQRLINALTSHLKAWKMDPNGYAMGLYNVDYEGITIVEAPTSLRKYYTVIPDLSNVRREPKGKGKSMRGLSHSTHRGGS
ncbi:MAG: hypothetical protein QXE79_00865 [Candidatus Bathyarchaeia archaeon]